MTEENVPGSEYVNVPAENIIKTLRRRLQNVIERDDSDWKYVEIVTHHVSSIGAPSRRAVLIRGTNTKL
jgi:hypothetical protein